MYAGHILTLVFVVSLLLLLILWYTSHPFNHPHDDDDKVTAITKTRNNHQKILDKLGSNTPKNFNLVQMEELSTSTKQQKFTNVVFCAPPSGSEDYPATVKDAVENLWAGSENGGTFVFTSSGGMYVFVLVVWLVWGQGCLELPSAKKHMSISSIFILYILSSTYSNSVFELHTMDLVYTYNKLIAMVQVMVTWW